MASFVKPHHPFDPPAPWDTMYDPAALTILPGWTNHVPDEDGPPTLGYFPNGQLTEAALRRVMAHYYGTISHVDHQVGRLLDVLRRRGLYERTMIVFTADHGEYLGFHHLLLKGGRMYEPLARVPLLIRFPGGACAGDVRHTLVNTVDVAPTILRQAGIEPPGVMRGLDLIDPNVTRDVVFAEQGRGPHYLARSRTHKLLFGTEPARTAFFDLEADPFELRNRIDDPSCAEAVHALRDALANWMLFQSSTPGYVDDHAPLVRAPNVPSDAGLDARDARRRAMLDYYEQHLARSLSSS
jgi:arylsulfatase A-like enzyme